MMEKYYAFIKDNRVLNVAVFASQDEALADAIAKEQGYDDAIWVAENAPTKWSSYDGETFTEPTQDYLISIGAVSPTAEVIDEAAAE
jgi:hypothetical protein